MGMSDKMTEVCAPSAAPTAAPAKHAPVKPTCLAIADYPAFGHCFSAATAGHPWSYILKVEAAVTGGSSSSFSAEVGALRNFYQNKATFVSARISRGQRSLT